MVIGQYIPSVVIENALQALKSLGKDSNKYGLSVDEMEQFWSVHFMPLNPNRRGGEVKVHIAKDSFDIVEVLRYQ